MRKEMYEKSARNKDTKIKRWDGNIKMKNTNPSILLTEYQVIGTFIYSSN